MLNICEIMKIDCIILKLFGISYEGERYAYFLAARIWQNLMGT